MDACSKQPSLFGTFAESVRQIPLGVQVASCSHESPACRRERLPSEHRRTYRGILVSVRPEATGIWGAIESIGGGPRPVLRPERCSGRADDAPASDSRYGAR